jgi:uncharacterized protein (DUF736 family)
MSKYVNIGAGWLKSKKDGSQFISGLFGDKKSGLKVLLQNEKGEIVELTNVAIFFNQQKKKDSHPDVNFTITLEE